MEKLPQLIQAHFTLTEKFAGTDGMTVGTEDTEPNPMPTPRRKSAGGTASRKNSQPTPGSVSGASGGGRRSRRRQAEPEPHFDDHDDDEDDEQEYNIDDIENIDDEGDDDVDEDEDDAGEDPMSGLFGSLARPGDMSADDLSRFQTLMNTLASGGLYGRQSSSQSAYRTVWDTMLKDLKNQSPAKRYEALQEATTTIALAQEDSFSYFPWEEAVKVFLGLVSGHPIVDQEANQDKKGKKAKKDLDDDSDEDEADTVQVKGGSEDGFDAHDFESMTEEEQMRYAMALSSGSADPASMAKGGSDLPLDPEQDQQAQLLACRCLQNLMMSSEGHGMTAGYIVRNDGVKVLCQKLQTIENIELAEQVIVTLAKLAEYQSRGTGIVQQGGLEIMLNILDFFDIHVQKSIVSAVIYSCRHLTPADFPKIKVILPHIRGLFSRSDLALVEGAANILYRLLNSYVYKGDILEDILDRDMIDAMNKALMPGSGSPSISPSVFANLLKVLTAGVRSSAKVTLTLYQADIQKTIYFILTGLLPPDAEDIEKGQTEAPAEAVILQNLGVRAKEQIEEVLALACELLPPPPRDGVFDARNYSERMLARYVKAKDKLQRQIEKGITPDQTLEEIIQTARQSAVAAAAATTSSGRETPINAETPAAPATPAPGGVASTPPSRSGSGAVPQGASLSSTGLNHAMDANRQEAEAALAKRKQILQENPELVNSFIKILIPVLVDVYNASAAIKVRTRILNALLRSVSYSGEAQLKEALQNVPLAGFLSSILTSRDDEILVTNALQLAESLLVKLPDIYMRSFQREGVFHEIDKLAGEELSPTAVSKRKEAAAAAAASGSTSDKATPKSKETPTNSEARSGGDLPLPQSLLKALTGEDGPSGSGPASALERALGIARSGEAASTSSARRTSSVPTDPHDANIVRARVIQVKRWSLRDASSNTAKISSGVDQVIETLSNNDVSDEVLRQAFDRIADLLTDKTEPLSSFEMLQSGLMSKLMNMLQEGDKAVAHRAVLFDALSQIKGDAEYSPLALLVKRLQDSLSRLDSFDVESATPSGTDGDPKLSSMLRTMTVQLAADSESPLPVPWKPKIVEISLPCVAPISTINSFLRSSSRLSDGQSSAAKTDLESMFESAAANASSSSTRGGSAPEKPSARRSARLQGKAADEPEASDSKAQSDKADAETTPKQKSTARLEEDEEGWESSGDKEDKEIAEENLIGEDMIIDEDDLDEDMDDMDAEGMFLDSHLDDMENDDPEGDGDQLQEKTVDLEVPSDGSKPQGHTPEGTRVATPQIEASAADSSRVAGVPPKIRSYAAALKAPSTDYHYRFAYKGQDLGYQESLYGAISRINRAAGDPTKISFYDRHSLKVKKVEGPAPLPGEYPRDTRVLMYELIALSIFILPGCEAEVAKHVDPASDDGLPKPLEKGSSLATVLLMLRTIHAINEDHRDKSSETDPRILDEGAFINSKLTAKFIRQLDEILLVAW